MAPFTIIKLTDELKAELDEEIKVLDKFFHGLIDEVTDILNHYEQEYEKQKDTVYRPDLLREVLDDMHKLKTMDKEKIRQIVGHLIDAFTLEDLREMGEEESIKQTFGMASTIIRELGYK